MCVRAIRAKFVIYFNFTLTTKYRVHKIIILTVIYSSKIIPESDITL